MGYITSLRGAFFATKQSQIMLEIAHRTGARRKCQAKSKSAFAKTSNRSCDDEEHGKQEQ